MIKINKETAMEQSIGVLMLVGMLSACVTINIYFPAAAAQEVADEIIDDVWQLKSGKENADEAKAEADSSATEEAK